MSDPSTTTRSAAPAAGGDAVPTSGWRERWSGTPVGNLLVLALVTALVLAGAWLMNRSQAADAAATPVDVVAGDAPPPEVGSPATDFLATTTDGQQVHLSELEGRPVWLSFVATWCSSCRAEAPDIQDAWVESGGGVELVSIYLAEGDEQVQTYADRLGMTYPQVADPQNEISGQYRVMAVPSHVFIDADGVVRSTHVGVLTPDQMRESLAEVSGR